jgi:hypothetical protein
MHQPGARPGNHRRALSASSEMSRAAWVQRALPDGSAINDSFTRQGWPFLPETKVPPMKNVIYEAVIVQADKSGDDIAAKIILTEEANGYAVIVPADKSGDDIAAKIILTEEANGYALFFSDHEGGRVVLQWFNSYERNTAIEQAVKTAASMKQKNNHESNG